jgi:pimeloyl-ACP methyl ester carboxylesterase
VIDIRIRMMWRHRYSVTPLLVVILLLSAPGVRSVQAQAAVPAEVGKGAAKPDAIEIRQGLSISVADRERRAAISADPVAAQVVAGTWAMPKRGDAVTLANGQTRKWEPVKAGADGSFPEGVARGGYIATSISAAEDAIMILEASGHSLALVNGEPQAGDVYNYGWARQPVRLRKGPNTLLFQMGRGSFKARLTIPPATAFFNTNDVTTPDLITGETADTEAAILIVNATDAWRRDLAIVSRIPGGDEIRTPVPALLPLSARKVGFGIKGPGQKKADRDCQVELKLVNSESVRGSGPSKIFDQTSVGLRVRGAGEAQKRTFRSQIDGSVQYYSVVPALPPSTPAATAQQAGLVLTLHGASVEGIGQAQAYSPKPGLHIVAPTNRRPYGFDWEDWGRLDAIEVLELAGKSLSSDPRRTYLTGHSMGGHGTWHVGVTFPDRFAAIAPSAGWVSMSSYAGARPNTSSNPLDKLRARATSPSDTLSLVRNLAPLGIYVLHGDADDNVPVAQARTMRKALAEFHPDFAYFEQPGAGHWWGNQCVDWPPLFAFLDRHRLPTVDAIHSIDFTTASPGVSPRAHWLSIESQIRALTPSSAHIKLDPDRRRFSGTTDNISRLSIDVMAALPKLREGDPVEIELDGQKISGPKSPAGRSIWLARIGSKWNASLAPPSLALKGPHRYGPFKDAFRNRFMLVIGTTGSSEENAWGLARARFDAETFWYRGNGSVDIVTDTEFNDPVRAPEFRDRNVIIYGHSQSNAAWAPLLADSPVQVRRGEIRIGERLFQGDNLACLCYRPRPTSDRAAIGVVAGSGMAGLRLTSRLPYFTSGVAYPDCLMIGSKVLSDTSAGPVAAGFFGDDWGIASGEFAYRD